VGEPAGAVPPPAEPAAAPRGPLFQVSPAPPVPAAAEASVKEPTERGGEDGGGTVATKKLALGGSASRLAALRKKAPEGTSSG
jgi:hypothetical protein